MEHVRGSVPIKIAARVYGKDENWVRTGIVCGWLPIGQATRKGRPVTTLEEMSSRYGRINYYVSPKRFFDETGFVWDGEKA
ncbi:MAG: hypothetical protein RSD95_08530 [Clostridia bacterium]